MKKFNLLFVCLLLTFGIHAQGIIGAWESHSTSENGDPLKTVRIFVDGYHVSTTFHNITGSFVETHGGSWYLKDDVIIENIEFDTNNPERVGTEVSYKLKIANHEIEIGDRHQKFTRIDDGTPGA